MISEIIKYVSHSFERTKQEHNSVNDVILKSALAYQYLYIKNFKMNISIDLILKTNYGEIGLIGPGNGCLTSFCERIFKNSEIMHSHSILHDAFGRFREHFHKDRGYMYTINKNKTPNWMKKSPLCGQISGIIYCVSNKIVI